MYRMDKNTGTESRDRKREQFTNQPASKRRVTPVIILVILALAGLGIYLVVSSPGDQPAATSVTSPASTGASDKNVRIPIAELEGGKARFFDYKTADNKALRFFVVKSSDGVYRAALDACDTCFHSKKGYHQQGDEMVCNNCGLKFHTALINEVKGGCNPIGLTRTIDGDQIVIKGSDLESGGRYF
jgi:uncharacterized membrane protein